MPAFTDSPYHSQNGFLVSTHKEMVVFFQVHSSNCFHFYSTVLSYYEQQQKEQSDGVHETGWWQTAVLCLAAQFVPAANPSKYPKLKSKTDYTVLTLVKAHYLKKTSILLTLSANIASLQKQYMAVTQQQFRFSIALVTKLNTFKLSIVIHR